MKKDDQNMQPLRLDGQTLVDQLQTLASVGTDPRGGRTRLAASKEEGEGRDLLVEWMKELDLEVTVDSVGNIFGLLSARQRNAQFTVAHFFCFPKILFHFFDKCRTA